jgi:hypothetical protein
MLGRLKFEIEPLVNQMLDQIPADIIINGTILDPAIGGGQFVREVERRKRATGKTDAEIRATVFGFEENVLRKNYAVNKHKLVGNYKVANFLEKDFKNMKFDAILGNPPYQDGTKDGGQNKIYNQFSKQALSLLKDDGHMAFVTPVSVLKDSKRFSLVNMPGLKIVDFRADNYFDVGIKICWWLIDKTYIGDVSVYNNNESYSSSAQSVIYDHSTINKDFAKIYESLKYVTDKPEDRMFKMNAVDTKTGRSLVKDSVFKYPVYKIDNRGIKFVQYNKPMPKFYQKLKFVISMTKGFSDDAIIISTNDFDVAHLCIEINNSAEVDNIKSFIFSEYFIKHSENWKNVDGYGFNYALKHLPPFDTSKMWTNDEVKDFIESHVT